MALKMKPSITPTSRRVFPLRTLEDAVTIRNEAAAAPMKAAMAMLSPPGTMVPAPPASTMVATAAPVPAPALTPIMCGSASGFRKMACIWAPAAERAPPARIAVRTRGMRICDITS